MGLESGTWVSDLVKTNPTSSDNVSQGDDHLRLVKTVLQNTFPNAGKAFYFPDTATKSADFSVTAAQMNVTFLVDTSGGNVAMTLPTLASGDAGWFCYLMKTTTDANAIFVTPPSGTIQSGALSGLAKTRRAISGVACKVWWTGSAFIAERAERAPVGAIIDFDGASLPVGYEWPNGQTLAGVAGSLYPDYYSQKGTLVVSDLRGRSTFGKDDMGGVAAGRLTAGNGLDGTTLDAAGGEQVHTLVTAEIPTHTHSITDPGHTHGLSSLIRYSGTAVGAGASDIYGRDANPTQLSINSSTTGITGTNASGGDGSHNNVPPAIVMNKLLVVE